MPREIATPEGVYSKNRRVKTAQKLAGLLYNAEENEGKDVLNLSFVSSDSNEKVTLRTTSEQGVTYTKDLFYKKGSIIEMHVGEQDFLMNLDGQGWKGYKDQPDNISVGDLVELSEEEFGVIDDSLQKIERGELQKV